MQPADVLHNGAPPGNRHGEKQGVEPRCVEPFADKPARCQQYSPGNVLGGARQGRRECPPSHAAPETYDIKALGLELSGKDLQVTDSFGQHQRRPLGADNLDHILADEGVPTLVVGQLAQDPLELETRIGVRFSLATEAGRSDKHFAL